METKHRKGRPPKEPDTKKKKMLIAFPEPVLEMIKASHDNVTQFVVDATLEKLVKESSL